MKTFRLRRAVKRDSIKLLLYQWVNLDRLAEQTTSIALKGTRKGKPSWRSLFRRIAEGELIVTRSRQKQLDEKIIPFPKTIEFDAPASVLEQLQNLEALGYDRNEVINECVRKGLDETMRLSGLNQPDIVNEIIRLHLLKHFRIQKHPKVNQYIRERLDRARKKLASIEAARMVREGIRTDLERLLKKIGA